MPDKTQAPPSHPWNALLAFPATCPAPELATAFGCWSSRLP